MKEPPKVIELFVFLNAISFQEQIYCIQKIKLTCKYLHAIRARVLYSKRVLQEIHQNEFSLKLHKQSNSSWHVRHLAAEKKNNQESKQVSLVRGAA